MNQQLITQAQAIFDTPEKWNSFLELISLKDEIRNQWYTKLKEDAIMKFSTDEHVDGWAFKAWGLWDMRWYQEKHGEKSISIVLSWWGQIALWCDSSRYNMSELERQLNNETFAPLKTCFTRLDGFNNENCLLYECRNYSFENSPYNTKFDLERLAWYAGNNTELFLSQIVEKVNRFRKDEQMNLLIDKLNENKEFIK